MGFVGHALPHKSRPALWGVALLLLVTVAMLSIAVTLSASSSAARARESALQEHESVKQLLEDIKKQVNLSASSSAAYVRESVLREHESLKQLLDDLKKQVNLAVSSSAASERESALREHESVKQLLDDLKKQVQETSQELKNRVNGNSRDVGRQAITSGEGQVRDEDVHHVATLDADCKPLNSSTGLGLKLKITQQLVAPVVVVAHARPHYLAKTMLAINKYWSADPANSAKFPLFISIDGDHQPTLTLATSLVFSTGVQVIRVARGPAHSKCDPRPPYTGFCSLALHYKTLLQLFFNCLQAPRLLFMEEDLEIAPDFFIYFEATAPLLDQDSSLYCVSAWNDQGQFGRAYNSTALYRTDVFPGLGWLLTRQVGLELLPAWPALMWDDRHLRNANIRRGRQCVFPEVPRTHTFGSKGTSDGLYYKQHLENMVLNTEHVEWTHMDLSYLTATKYEQLMRQWLNHSQPFSTVLPQGISLKEYCNVNQPPDTATNDAYIVYGDNAGFQQLAKQLEPIMFSVDNGAHMPRGAYSGTGHGVVIVRCRQRRLFLVSKDPHLGQQ